MHKLEHLREKSLKFNIVLNDSQLDQFSTYLDLLIDYNKHTNITGDSDAETIIHKHFLDSLAFGLVIKEIGLQDNFNIIDIGIGGGFPGIPLLIAFPGWHLCAVDSVGKKIKFLDTLCESIGIAQRVELKQARAEELAKDSAKREFFDIALIRAVAKLNVISEYCLPFVRQGGYFAAYKSKTAQIELEQSKKALSVLGGTYLSSFKYTLTGEEERHILLISKSGVSPEKYPRKVGIPAKNPLI